jgi:hypothetical protein
MVTPLKRSFTGSDSFFQGSVPLGPDQDSAWAWPIERRRTITTMQQLLPDMAASDGETGDRGIEKIFFVFILFNLPAPVMGGGLGGEHGEGKDYNWAILVSHPARMLFRTQ